MSVKRKGDKSLLSKQEIASRRKALNQKKNTTSGSGRRAILGVLILALSVMSLLAVATFSAADRIGPGFKNAVGPVGHAIAEALRGLLGVCAYVLPMVGLYASGILFVGDREKRRWPQAIALSLLLVAGAILAQLMFKEDATWAHAPGGLIGREIGGILTALFSTVGTVVLVSAIAAVAFIVGTEFAFLRFVNFVFEKSQVFGAWLKAQAVAWMEKQKSLAAQRREQAEKDAEEEAAFLAQLEEEEAELAELEATADEAEAAANEALRIQQDKENAKLADLAEKERLKAEREKALIEREAAKLAREALKTARANRKDQQKDMAAAIAPSLLHDLRPPTSMAVNPRPAEPTMPAANNGDPAWASAFSFAQPQQMPPPPPAISSPPLPSEYLESVPPPPRRVPTIREPLASPTQAAITEPPALPPVVSPVVTGRMDAVVSAPKVSPLEASLSGAQLMDAAAAMAPAGAQALAPVGAAVAAGVGATALARMPLIVEPKAPPKPTKKDLKKQDEFVFSGGRSNFEVPPIDLLEVHRKERAQVDKEVYLQTAERLTAKLRDFGIDGEVVEIRPGPVVTMYEFKPAPGVKISRIASLSDDLAMAMEAMRVRIVAPIPGKGVVGVEVPNKDREMVFLKEIAEQDAFQKSQSRLTMCLGKDIEGMPYILDLAKAPHLLMAGTTGSGKSVSVNAMIMSILLKSTPEEVRFIMVDPKMLELSVYEGIPHLLLPVVTDPRKASIALQWAVDEMTRRYKLLSEAGVRNITGYNTMVEAEHAKKRAAQTTIDAKPTVIKPKEAAPVAPVIPSKVVEEPAKPVEASAAPAATPPEAAGSDKPKKKRRMLIVDVADPMATTATPPEMPAVSAEGAPVPAGLELGVAAPKDEATDPREAVVGEEPIVTPALVEAEAAAKEGEIRVDEPTEQEAAALAQAAAVAAAEEAAAAEGPEEKKKLPYIVVIIDELADLMMVASKEVETSIARLAQMARAAGIHLMVATQRPSTDVVTGIIKANFPTRISFMLRSKPDSMTILGTVGAEALLGMGDMLIMPPTSAHLQRVHGCFVSEHEIKKVVDQLKAQGTPVYDESILKPREDEGGGEVGEEDELHDELYDQAIAIVSEMRTVSISILQRKMRIGYNRSARMIERMEREGLVGPADGAKPRDVLVKPVGQMPGAGAMM